jgi:c-di-GMP-binding flagellar brake protein YcgR
VVETTFARHIGPRPGRLFAITRPGDVRAIRLRTFIRLEVVLPIQISASIRGKFFSGTGQTVDISAGGACFECSLPLHVGDRITVQVQTTVLDAAADAEVVRVDPPDERLGRRAQWVAVRYVSVLQSDQDAITRFIYSETRRRIQHGETGL